MPKSKRDLQGATRSKGMLALCYECCAGYKDGKLDCENSVCPMYSWMPYAKLDPDYTWMELNYRRKGE